MRVRQLSLPALSALLLLICGRPVMAGDARGKLLVHADPREAYVYADGEPVVEAKAHYVTLTAGEHKIDLYNYGYKPESRTVTIVANRTTRLDVNMQPDGGKVTGPWGCITLERAAKAAVMLNGKEPDLFLVGHGDEFNHEWWWKQELIVPPGKQTLTVQYMTHEPWTFTVDVQANKRYVVAAYQGLQKTVDWPRGQQLKELPEFHAGFANAQVVVEKVTGNLATNTGQVNCGESAQLTWSSTGAARAELNGAPVSASGNEAVQPKQTTDYKFKAMGPGGVYTSDATVNVNPAITASLNVTPAEVRLADAGGGQEGTATLTWSAAGAESVTVDPLGSVGSSGSREVQIKPVRDSQGGVDQTVTYTLHATNACGGSETRTATLHLTGNGVLQGAANETTLASKLTINSIYFPTDWPTVNDPQNGLVPSQQSRVQENAVDFKQYLGLKPDAKLVLEAYCDVRGSVEYNQALAERRAELVKQYLIGQGIPAGQIETKAYGKTRQLTDKQVEELTAENPDVTPQERQRMLHNIVVFQWANNRRVDIRLSTTGEISQRYYPINSSDVTVLLGVKEPTSHSASLK